VLIKIHSPQINSLVSYSVDLSLDCGTGR